MIPTIKVALIGLAWLNDMLLTWQVMMTLKFFVTVIAVKLVKVTVMEIAYVPSCAGLLVDTLSKFPVMLPLAALPVRVRNVYVLGLSV